VSNVRKNDQRVGLPTKGIGDTLVVTDRHLCGGIAPLVKAVDASVVGGIHMVQLREKDLPPQELLALAQSLRSVTKDRALLFVNVHDAAGVEIAQACGADGLQLAEAALPVEWARQLVGDEMLIGRSVHNLEGALAAAESEADLLILGTVFPSATHPEGTTVGVELVRTVTEHVATPVYGIGGITAENAAQVLEAGASGVAVVRAVLAAPDPKQAARRLLLVMDAGHALHRPVRRGSNAERDPI